MDTAINTTVVEEFVAAYERFLSYGDKRVEDMLLMSSPLPTAAICIFYLYFSLSLGPKYMKDRKPYNLRNVILCYNIFQVIFNTVLFICSIYMWIKHYGWGLSCLPVYPNAVSYGEAVWGARLCHLYYINKVSDLLDTVFFVLKKKNDKISLLHVFHHAVMPFSCWFGVKFHPGGNLSFFGLPNMFVHIWMYLYYLVAILGPQYQKYIWWKRHLTEMQLIQFGMVGIYVAYISSVCNLSYVFSMWCIALDIIFIYLFFDFYRKAYRRKQLTKEHNARQKLAAKVE